MLAEQGEEQIELLGPEIDRGAGAFHGACGRAELDIAETDPARCGCGESGVGAPEECADPSEQLGQRHRPGNEVVGAEPKAVELCLFIVAGHEDDDRHVVTAAAHRAQQLVSVASWQDDIEDHETGWRVEHALETLRHCRCDVDDESLDFQTSAQCGGEGRAVLDDQHTERCAGLERPIGPGVQTVREMLGTISWRPSIYSLLRRSLHSQPPMRGHRVLVSSAAGWVRTVVPFRGKVHTTLTPS